MINKLEKNIDNKVVQDFGYEWNTFNQSNIFEKEQKIIFDKYFRIFPWNIINKNSVGFDLGCGSGRWAKIISKKVGYLHCIDPSDSIEIAKKNLSTQKNCSFHKADIDNIPLDDQSMDFGYCLGVLHHIPDTYKGIISCSSKLKSGAPLLIYIYYNFDNRSKIYFFLWKISDFFRKFISKLPHILKRIISLKIAMFIYFPIARLLFFLNKMNIQVSNFPLSPYANLSFNTMKTDAYDRFCTRLEKRYSQKQINNMMLEAGFKNIKFSNEAPYWCAVGIKR